MHVSAEVVHVSAGCMCLLKATSAQSQSVFAHVSHLLNPLQEAEGTFMVAFSSADVAVEWCLMVQQVLRDMSWPDR